MDASQSGTPVGTAFSERHPKIVKMRHFPQKPQLFDVTLCRQQNVLSWKMIARHHSKVQLTVGTQGMIPTLGFTSKPIELAALLSNIAGKVEIAYRSKTEQALPLALFLMTNST